MYVCTDILLYIYCISDNLNKYMHMYTNVVVACDPSHTLWRVATAVRMRNDHWHAWTKKPWRISPHLPIWTVFRQQWWAAFVWYFCDMSFKIPQTWDPEKQNPWYVFTYVYIYICFLLRVLEWCFRRLIWEQHIPNMSSCCVFT